MKTIKRMNLLILCLLGAAAVQAAKPPNIIFVLTDDQGYGDLACHGNPIIQTPNLDKLYAQSTRFTDYHVSPTCSPSRAALMSGKNPFEVGVTHTVCERERMALGTTTVAEALKKGGYTTGIFGKWHLGDEDAYRPENRGFDEVFIHGAGGIGQVFPGTQWNPKNDYFDPSIFHNGAFVKTTGYCTDVFTQQALGWIKQQDEKPFFAYIAFNAPHGPFKVADKYKAIYQNHPEAQQKDVAAFLGMVTNIDENMGLLMEKLDAWGLAENTLLVFSTDNGTSRGNHVYNAGMKGKKGWTNEGGTRVPLFFRLPGKTPTGLDIDTLTRHIDILPTFAELAGVDVSDLKLDGRSLLPLLENKNVVWPDRKLFFHQGRWAKAGAPKSFGIGDSNPDHHKNKSFAVRTEKWRLVGDNERGGKFMQEALYDIDKDPGENNNVISQHPKVVAELKEAYYEFWDRARPLMINEDASLDVGKPLELIYNKQMAEGGIPKWVMPEL